MAKKKIDPLEVLATSPVGKAIAGSPLGRSVATRLGVPPAPVLRRGRTDPPGPVVVAAVGGGDLVASALSLLGVITAAPVVDVPKARKPDDTGRQQPPRYAGKIGALVLDLTRLSTIAELEQVRGLLRPAVRALAGSGRVILVGRAPESLD